MKFLNVLLIAIVSQGLVFVCHAQEAVSDLERYIKAIRAKRMSENAEGSLHTVGSLVTGGILVTYSKMDGSERLYPSYQSTFCPLPNADQEEVRKLQESQVKKVQEVLEVLKPLADSDGSGFISTPEAAHFRQVIEHGYLCHEVTKTRSARPSTIALASGLSEEAAVDLLAEYTKCRTRLSKEGLELPEVSMATDE